MCCCCFCCFNKLNDVTKKRICVTIYNKNTFVYSGFLYMGKTQSKIYENSNSYSMTTSNHHRQRQRQQLQQQYQPQRPQYMNDDTSYDKTASVSVPQKIICDKTLTFDEYWFKQQQQQHIGSSNRNSGLRTIVEPPTRVDLRRTVCFPYPETKDQGPDGSCVAYAMSTALYCAQNKALDGLADDLNRSNQFYADESSLPKPPSSYQHQNRQYPSIDYNSLILFDENQLFDQIRESQNIPRPVSKGLTFSEAVKGVCEQAIEPQQQQKQSSNRIYDYLTDKQRINSYDDQINNSVRQTYAESSAAAASIRWKRIGISVENFRYAMANGYAIVLGISVSPRMRAWQHNRSVLEQTNFLLPISTAVSVNNENGGSSDPPSTNGFHCVLLVGYDDEFRGGVFIVRNSWGQQWGYNGHFLIPYALIEYSGKIKKYVFALDAMIVEYVSST